MKLPDIVQAFNTACSRDKGALMWGNPEPWVHAELYAEFKKQAPDSSWKPFDTEVPYVTAYPVQIPKTSNRDWISEGAVKWVDLCLQVDISNDWCWFEFKVRHAGETHRNKKAALEARDVFRKDIVALMGFDANATADIWKSPDYYTTAYWFESALKPYTEKLRLGNHHFVSAFLQLGGNLDEEIWNKEAIVEQVNFWKAHRGKHRGEKSSEVDYLNVSCSQIGSHWLVSVEW
jgi:hypothetical protein